MKKWAIHSVSPSLFRQVRSAVKRLDTTPLVVKLATYHPNPLYWMHTSDNVAEKSHSRWFLSTFCASLGIERDTLRRRFTNSATPPFIIIKNNMRGNLHISTIITVPERYLVIQSF